MEEAERLCDRIAIVDHGKRIALGTPRELIATLQATNIIEFTSTPALEESEVCAMLDCQGVTRRGDRWQMRVDSLAVALPQLVNAIDARGARLDSLSTHAATLEDLFVALTGRELRDA
jgi:ABC-2 type transport system ATP-binding protein